MIVVPDAGPLIYLAGAGHLDLLRELYAEVIVPRAVYEEVAVAGAGLLGAAAVAEASWFRVDEAPADPELSAILGAGEASAIALAEHIDATVLLDDREARAIAASRGLRVIGTVGVLVAAKKRGLLVAVGPVLDEMAGLGMFVSRPLRTRALQLASESNPGD